MREETKQTDALSPEIQDVMRNLVAAIRAVKLYPPNNPVYSQSVKKSYETLRHFLETTPEYHVEVQKTWFTYQHTPLGKDAQLNRAIVQDLFGKGIREVVFSNGMLESELMDLCRALALSSEELAMKSGISSILWEKGADHIKVTEAGLDEVITTKAEGGWADKTSAQSSTGIAEPAATKKTTGFPGRSLVLGDLLTDPSGFGASMVELAKQTRAEHETVEDRLFSLYQEAGRKIQKEEPGRVESLFEGLAKSVLALDPHYRDGFIAGKLYGELDSETASAQESEADQQLPSALQEIQTGRFPDTWSVQQVATLLKKASAKKTAPPTAPKSPAELETVPLSQDLVQMAKELAEYSPKEMAALKALSGAGMESDIIEAAVRTMIYLLSLVKNPRHTSPDAKEIARFSGVVHQLEDMLSYLLQKKDYAFATLIMKAFSIPVDPAFQPRIMEARRKTVSKPIIVAAIGDMRKHPKRSSEYQSAYTYVSASEREATEVLLELLAEEHDRSARLFYLDLVKNLSKNQIALLGEHLIDGRWYFVRNIVSILGESKADQAIAFLRKAADHENVRIRQEVIKGLTTIGGKKAAGVLAKFLRDKDADVQVMALRAFADIQGIGVEEVQPVVEFLEERPLKKKDLDLTLEAINVLGKTGGRDAAGVLKGYDRIRWWKSRKLQMQLKEAALRAVEDITRRKTDGGTRER